MRFPILGSVTTWLGSLLFKPATPLVPAKSKAAAAPAIIEASFKDVTTATAAPAAGSERATATATATPPAIVAASRPSAADLSPDLERPLVASIGSHAAVTAIDMPRREPEDFRLASRLSIIARMNRPVVSSIAEAKRAPRSRSGKKSSPGCLSPVLARGTRPQFFAPLAAAA